MKILIKMVAQKSSYLIGVAFKVTQINIFFKKKF